MPIIRNNRKMLNGLLAVDCQRNDVIFQSAPLQQKPQVASVNNKEKVIFYFITGRTKVNTTESNIHSHSPNVNLNTELNCL